MNKERRKAVAAIVDELERLRDQLQEVLDAEQEAFDNLPESFQDGERGEAMQEAIDTLEQGVGDITDTMDNLVSLT